jgi:hypothetical protein
MPTDKTPAAKAPTEPSAERANGARHPLPQNWQREQESAERQGRLVPTRTPPGLDLF